MHRFVAIALTMSMFSVSVSIRSAEVAAPARPTAAKHQDKQLKWGPCPEFMPKGCALAVLHGDPSKPNADIFFKVPASSQIARHWHSSAERMVLVSGALTVTYDGEEPITLKPGMYAYGPAKLPHKASCGKAGPCVLFIAFEGPVDAVPSEGETKRASP